MSDDLRSAVAAGVLGAEKNYRELLQSIVEVARAIFRAKASSIFLLDEASDELVFEAVAGEGSESLIGRRFPSSTGIAGFVQMAIGAGIAQFTGWVLIGAATALPMTLTMVVGALVGIVAYYALLGGASRASDAT